MSYFLKILCARAEAVMKAVKKGFPEKAEECTQLIKQFFKKKAEHFSGETEVYMDSYSG